MVQEEEIRETLKTTWRVATWTPKPAVAVVSEASGKDGDIPGVSYSVVGSRKVHQSITAVHDISRAPAPKKSHLSA